MAGRTLVCQVCAEHEDKNEAGETRRRLFVRQYRLPKGVDVEHIRPSLSKDGVLTVEAPAPGLAPSERLVPIQYQSEDAGNRTTTA
jgi:HSP20 family molecular chaperone IbpA